MVCLNSLVASDLICLKEFEDVPVKHNNCPEEERNERAHVPADRDERHPASHGG